MVAAINQISGSTGVKAVDTGSSTNGVQLVAADGRNIEIYNNVNTGVFTAATTGVTSTDAGTATGAMTIFTGTLTLQSNTSSPITIGTTNTGNISRAGFAVGSYAANTSVMTGAGRVSGILSGTPTTLSSGDLVINGVSIGASLATDDTVSANMASSSNKSASAIAISAAINKQTDKTGVKAVAQANTYTGIGYSVVSATGNIYLNGQTIAITTTASSKAIDVVNQINNYASATGVVASDNGLGVTLTAADGRNIELGITATGGMTLNSLGLNSSVGDTAAGRAAPMLTATSAGSAVTVYYAGVNLISDKSFTVAAGAGATANANLKGLGIAEGTYGGSNNGTKIGSVDISTVAGANDALNAVDAALGQISDQRSNLGAIQNRLQAAVDNLTSSSTNLQAAQGRIQDTDYSTTTTQMSKSQIISQAATAMLAQANQQPQMVLSLLK